MDLKDVLFEEVGSEADVPELTAVMTRAFDDDTQKHLGQERGGPPGYDDGEFFRKWLFGCPESVGYKIVTDGRMIGGMIVWVFRSGHNALGTVFVDPGYQDQGVGAGAWAFVEESYPETKSWKLETPRWATKNHYFYEEKCGFRKVDETEDAFVYKKEMRKDEPRAEGRLIP